MNSASVRYTNDNEIKMCILNVPPVSVSRDTLCSLCHWRRSLISDAHQGTVCTTLLAGYACNVLTKKDNKTREKIHLVPIMALFRIENPLDGAPSVAPSVPA